MGNTTLTAFTDENGDVRPAASLLLISGHRNPRVLMGRRPAGARFMPGVYVFPGGACEEMDFTTPFVSAVSSAEVRLMQATDDSLGNTLAIAAIRETLEETGLLCACGSRPKEAKWSDVLSGRLKLDLSCLNYLGRALTPPVSRIRFHARFFYLCSDLLEFPRTETPELEDIRWVDPSRPGDLRIAAVTRFMLAEVSRRLASDERPVRTPFYHRQGGEPEVVYDGAD